MNRALFNNRLLALALSLLLIPAAAHAATFAGPPDNFNALDIGTDKVFVRLNLMNAGKFIGSMDFAGGTHNTIKGTLDVSGSFSGTAIPSQTPYILVLTGSTHSTYLLTGSAAGKEFEGFPFAHIKGQTVTQQGIYTSYIVTTSTTPVPLIGYATLRVGKTGATMLSGKLPDATSFTAGGNVLAYGTSTYLVIFNDRALYNKKGLFSGYIEFNAGNISGPSFLWQKPMTKGPYYPDPFTASAAITGFPYSKAMGDLFTSGTTEFFGGMLTSSTAQAFTVANKRIVTVNSPNPLNMKLAINGATAAFRGSFNFPDSTHTLVKYSGILLQEGTVPLSVGYFRSPIVSGSGSIGYFEALP